MEEFVRLDELKRNPIAPVIWLLTLVLAAKSALTFVDVVWGRVAYPYDLEWMEGGMVDHMVRVLHGRPLYVAPSFSFAPFIYNPLFYWLGAAASLVVGVGPVALRSVAVLATFAICYVLFALVRQHTNSGKAGIVAAASFLATYELSGGWMDLARADTTFLALEGLAVLRCLSSKTRRAAVESALLVVLAFLAKQYAIVCAGPILLYFVLDRDFKRALWFTATLMLGVGGAVAALDVSSDGWYLFWTFELPYYHPSVGLDPREVFVTHVWKPLPLLLCMALAGVGLVLHRTFVSPSDSGRLRKWASPGLLLSIFVVLVVQAWSSFNHVGSANNCLMPAHVALSLFAGIGLGLMQFRSAPSATLLPLLVIAFQLHTLSYSAERWVPNAADRREALRLDQMLNDTQRPTLFAFRGFYGAEGRNPEHAHQMALLDLFKLKERYPDLVASLYAEAQTHFANKEYGQVVLDNWDYVFLVALQKNYRMVKETRVNDGPGWTPTGARMKPRIFFVPKE